MPKKRRKEIIKLRPPFSLLEVAGFNAAKQHFVGRARQVIRDLEGDPPAN